MQGSYCRARTVCQVLHAGYCVLRGNIYECEMVIP